MVGREDELARLQEAAIRTFSRGQRRVIFVAGEAGIGKTTFVQAFVDSIVARRHGASLAAASVSNNTARASLTYRCSRRWAASVRTSAVASVELLNRFAPTG